MPTSFMSTMSRANVCVSSSVIIALPPYLTTMVEPWNLRMYGRDSVSTLAILTASVDEMGIADPRTSVLDRSFSAAHGTDAEFDLVPFVHPLRTEASEPDLYWMAV